MIDLSGTLTSLLALCTCLLWLTAGTKLLLAVYTSRSRPDFLAGLGMLAGGLVVGLTTWPLAGLGAFPAEALVLGGALFWALYGDEANALQRGDGWLPVFAIGAGTFVLHLSFAAAGAQPMLDLGVVALRPFELPALMLLGYLWFRRLDRAGDGHSAGRSSDHSTGRSAGRGEGFTHLTRGNVRDMLLATAAASFASLVGGMSGDTFRFMFLCLAPASFLYRAAQANKLEICRIAGVAAACSLGFVGLDRAAQVQDQRAWLQVAVREVTDVGKDYVALQPPLNETLETWAHAEPQHRYSETQAKLTANLQHLQKSSARAGLREFAKSCQALGKLVVAHTKLSHEIFEAVAMRGAQWGNDEATGRAESRARSAHEESRSTFESGLAQLRDLEGHLAASVVTFSGGIDAMASVILGLTLAAALVGLALLTSAFGGRPTVTDRYAGAPAAVDEPATTGERKDTKGQATTEKPKDAEPQATPEPQPNTPPQEDTSPQEGPGQLNAELDRLARVMHDLSTYVEEEPVALSAYDCIAMLKDAARGLPNEELLQSASALERVLKTGGEHREIAEAAAQLSKVCAALGASTNES
ncbi:MAG: hypothetical protein ACYST0_12210 [Planctomycetota bacterium]